MRHALVATAILTLLTAPARSVATPAAANETSSANESTAPADQAPAPGDATVAASRMLAGRTFKVKVTPDAEAATLGESAFDDTLIFERSTVTMTECLKVGFAASPYTETSPTPGRADFDTTQTSENEGAARWSGHLDTVSTDDGPAVLRGAMVWTKKDGTVFHYTFDGPESR